MTEMDYVKQALTYSATTHGFSKSLQYLREKDDKIVALTADVARSTDLNEFATRFPKSFINVGIAEQNLIATSSGLAKSGMKPFVSLFSSFASMRALDFIFADVCYNKEKVVIVATHGGTSFGEAGPTHHSLSDVTIMRSMPNIAVVVCADEAEAANAVKAAYDYPTAVYVRLNRGLDRDIYDREDYGFEIGKSVKITDGKDAVVFANGSCVYEALAAARELKKIGISISVINAHTVAPFDKETALREIQKCKHVITVEDGRNTGLGGVIAELIADSGLAVKLIRLGVEGISPTGRHFDLMKVNGVDSVAVINAAKKLYD